jgi:hypothetical protein
MGRKWGTVFLLICLAFYGCPGRNAALIPKMPPLAKGKARVIFSRPDALYAMVLDAKIDINGKRAASLPNDDKIALDVSPGKTKITVSSFDALGEYSIFHEFKAGRKYRFEITPLKARKQIIRSALLGAVGQIIGLIAQIIGSLGQFVGVVVEKETNPDKSGTFKIQPTPPAPAPPPALVK